MKNQITAWSFSRIELYERCPAAFKHKHIDKLPDPGSPAMARGDTIHKGTARYLLRQGDLPKESAKFAPLMEHLRGLPNLFVEQQWGLTQRWKPTGWFGADTWLRVILDAGVVYEDNTADVIDHKTGKRYAHNNDQVELFAIAVFKRFPALTHVTTRLWYLDQGYEEVAEFDRAVVDPGVEKWNKRAAKLLGETVWPACPNEKCRWCAFGRDHGGPCKFG